MLSGRVVRAEEAVRIGLANAMLPDDAFVDRVVEWLEPVARHPRSALVAAKKAVVEGLRMPFADGLRLEGRKARLDFIVVEKGNRTPTEN